MTERASELAEQAAQAARSGNHIRAYELATLALEAEPERTDLRYLATLAIGRSGATIRAQELWQAWFGDEQVRARLWREQPELATDVEALWARLLKDMALAERSESVRSEAARQAALAYEAVARRLSADADKRALATFPAINAASLWQLAGNAGHARDLAAEVLQWLRGDGYWALATAGEALLLLGRHEEALARMARAAAIAGADLAALAATRRQISWLSELLGAPIPLNEVLPAPSVMHFAGHMFVSDPAVEATIAKDVDRALTEKRIGIAYGALACGADIVIAETLLKRGAELNVVLPVLPDIFLERSVSIGGPDWERRFRHCLARAASVTVVDEGDEADDAVLAYGSRHAMGLAIIRARDLLTAPCQLVVWNGLDNPGEVGTAADVRTWRSFTGGEPIVVSLPAATVRPTSKPGPAPLGERVPAALLFGDVQHYSRYTDRQTAIFQREVMPRLAQSLEGAVGERLYGNTWGDGIFLAFADAQTAARAAAALLSAASGIDGAGIGLPPVRMRLGGHWGPVTRTFDPIVGRPCLVGSHITRTARIEPVTPPGQFYLTAAFAAELVLGSSPELGCEYVGDMPLAKGFGRAPIYVMRHRPNLALKREDA